ncbi:MAG: hypothetical protein JEZ00_08995 [Anaerolineaceae bacterium]|nr:hypothetical protein [Anaerolineaceae bacterium]
MKRRKFLQFLSILMIISISFAAGMGTKTWIDHSNSQLPILHQAYKLLEDYAYKPPADDDEATQLEYGMISGLFQAFADPHSRFVAPSVHEVEMDRLEGVFGGIGAQIEKNAENVFLLYPVDDSPAQQAGMLNADVLLQVDDFIVLPESTMDDVISAIRGPVNTEVTLIILHQNIEESEILSVTRQEFSIPSVSYSFPIKNIPIGVIKVTIIAASTPAEIETALNALISQNAEAVVLDLRDNSGGYVDAGVNIAGMFLPRGDIIGKKFHDPEQDILLTYPQDGAYQEIPLYVFVNHNTASSAEIITGALQAQQRAKVIGTTTYGKNSVQLVFDLEDGSSVHITNAIWYIPGLSYDFSEHGVLPDVELADDQITIDTCLKIIEQDLQ